MSYWALFPKSHNLMKMSLTPLLVPFKTSDETVLLPSEEGNKDINIWLAIIKKKKVILRGSYSPRIQSKTQLSTFTTNSKTATSNTIKTAQPASKKKKKKMLPTGKCLTNTKGNSEQVSRIHVPSVGLLEVRDGKTWGIFFCSPVVRNQGFLMSVGKKRWTTFADFSRREHYVLPISFSYLSSPYPDSLILPPLKGLGSTLQNFPWVPLYPSRCFHWKS